jgi:hypothetical protein
MPADPTTFSSTGVALKSTSHLIFPEIKHTGPSQLHEWVVGNKSTAREMLLLLQ